LYLNLEGSEAALNGFHQRALDLKTIVRMLTPEAAPIRWRGCIFSQRDRKNGKVRNQSNLHNSTHKLRSIFQTTVSRTDQVGITAQIEIATHVAEAAYHIGQNEGLAWIAKGGIGIEFASDYHTQHAAFHQANLEMNLVKIQEKSDLCDYRRTRGKQNTKMKTIQT
jgi:hypothetical protein